MIFRIIQGIGIPGQSGTWVSDLLPHTAEIVDDICVIKSMHTDAANAIMAFPKKNAAQIIGSKRGDICDVNFLWPQTNLSVEESDLNGAKIAGAGKITEKDRLLSSQYKELNAKNRKKNRI